MKRFLVFFLVQLFAVISLAQVVAAPTPAPVDAYVPPVLLTQILTWVQGLPKVGPIVIVVLTAISVVATLMTVLSTFLLSIKASIQGIAKLAGAVTVIDKVEAIYQKIAPYVQFASMYNVQKKTDPPKTA